MHHAIATLEPHQKALLFFALNRLKENAESQIALATINGCDTSVRLFAKYTLDEAKKLQQFFFDDVAINEIDFIAYFSENFPAILQASNSEKEAGPVKP